MFNLIYNCHKSPKGKRNMASGSLGTICFLTLPHSNRVAFIHQNDGDCAPQILVEQKLRDHYCNEIRMIVIPVLVSAPVT